MERNLSVNYLLAIERLEKLSYQRLAEKAKLSRPTEKDGLSRPTEKSELSRPTEKIELAKTAKTKPKFEAEIKVSNTVPECTEIDEASQGHS